MPNMFLVSEKNSKFLQNNFFSGEKFWSPRDSNPGPWKSGEKSHFCPKKNAKKRKKTQKTQIFGKSKNAKKRKKTPMRFPPPA
jgi:hypothetical protein